MPIKTLDSLPTEILDSYAPDVYGNLPFLTRARRPRDCRFVIDTDRPDQGAVCIAKHPSPQLPLFAFFSTRVLDTRLSLFRSLEPGRYLFVLPDGDLVTALEQEMSFSEVHRNCVYAREESSDLDPGEARLLGSDDIPLLQSTHPRLVRPIQQGVSVFGVIRGGLLASSCIIAELLEHHWAIGNVYTEEAFRRKGYGKWVVSAAANYMLAGGRVPVYECDKENAPSRGLAETLGFSFKAVQFEGQAEKGVR